MKDKWCFSILAKESPPLLVSVVSKAIYQPLKPNGGYTKFTKVMHMFSGIFKTFCAYKFS